MSRTFATHSAEETRALGETIAAELRPGTLVCLEGDLGAGKTTFIQGVLAGLGADRPYVSPTFVLMKLYELRTPSPAGIRRVYHCDAYRIDDPADFGQLGFAEWCADPEGLVLLEWPERVAPLLPPQRIEATLCSVSETDRTLVVSEMDPISARL